MIRLIKELEMSAADVGYINISKPPLDYPELSTLSDEAFSCGFDQGFIWHPEFVSFHLLHVAQCDIKISISHKVEIEENSVRAIVVPFFVPKQGLLHISDDDPGDSFELESGHYKLLYQARYLTNEEIAASERYREDLGLIFELVEGDDRQRPELCLMTFIPADGVIEPEILRKDADLSPPNKLLLLDE